MEEIRICKKHGETSFIFEKRGSYRCKKCRVQAVSNRRRKLKELAVDYKGGKCEVCGYNKSIWALDFHHLHDKKFQISKGNTVSLEKLIAEVDKCMLLCANCHREHHHSESC